MFTLGVRRAIFAPADAHGVRNVTYSDPQPWSVYGYGPGTNTEPRAPFRDQVVTEWTVYAPASDEAPTEWDRVVIDGVDYDVEGRPLDYTHGPWEHPTAGLAVNLNRTEG